MINTKKDNTNKMTKIIITESQLQRIKESKEGVQFFNADEFLNNDGFKLDHTNDHRKYLINELNKIKNDFRNLMDKPLDSMNQNMGVWELHKLYKKYMIQIMRLRNMIEPHFQIQKMTHNRTYITYLVLTAYWTDENGKRIKKFKRTIGNIDKIMHNGQISNIAMEDAERHIENLMRNEYKNVYK